MKSFSKFIKEKNANNINKPEKIAMITAYDYPSALLAEAGGADIILVGDSLGNVIQGQSDTLPVTIDEMIYHTKMVKRAVKDTLVVLDLPFGTYEISCEETLKNAIRVIKETGVDAVKLEGGEEVCPQIRALTATGIPVVAHIGLTPQNVKIFGGYTIQGRTAKEAQKLINSAIALEKAGAMMLVLECIPANVAAEITAKISIPTIGIGAGVDCDGQVLVFHDLLNIYNTEKSNKFVKVYDNIGEKILQAITNYTNEVKSAVFPAEEHSFKMHDGEIEELEAIYKN